MRILVLNYQVTWRSRYLRSYYWGQYLARRGHNVTIVEVSSARHWGFDIREQDGMTLVGSPDMLIGKARNGWDPWDVLNRVIYTLPKKFDIVHSVDSRPVAILPALLCKYFRSTKLILDWGDWWGHGGAIQSRATSLLEYAFAPVETLFEEAFRKYADGSIVLSSALKQRAVSLGVNPKTILQTTTGADVERIRPRDKDNARQRLGFDLDAKLIGYVGVLYKEDQDLLAKAFSIICMMDPSVKLILVGRKDPKIVNENPAIQQRVIMVGGVSDENMRDYIAACDLMLLPLKDNITNRGRWPMKIGDYLAAGKPVVVTRVGDITSLFESEQCGILAQDTPDDFAAQAVNALQDKDLLEEMGQKARRVAETKLDWRLLTDQVEQFYTQVLNSFET